MDVTEWRFMSNNDNIALKDFETLHIHSHFEVSLGYDQALSLSINIYVIRYYYIICM